MEVGALIERRLQDIVVEDVDFVPRDAGGGPDLAYVLLRLPADLLRDYARLQGLRASIPDAAEFWIGSDLARRLRSRREYRGHAPLPDALDFLSSDVDCSYQALVAPSGFVRLAVYETQRACDD